MSRHEGQDDTFFADRVGRYAGHQIISHQRSCLTKPMDTVSRSISGPWASSCKWISYFEDLNNDRAS